MTVLTVNRVAPAPRFTDQVSPNFVRWARCFAADDVAAAAIEGRERIMVLAAEGRASADAAE
ncbi:MAG: hypothetical protein Rhirs2KO_09770 [Rhizobiaceae bacterium]